MDRKKARLYQKLVILLICLMIILRLVTLILSKYESESNSNAELDIAFYLLKEDYKTMTLNLASIFPQNEVYVYNFSIGNQEKDQIAEINIEYSLKIRTTTNLPLTFQLYKNEIHTDRGATDIIKTNEVEVDEYGTYFKTMTTENEILEFNIPKTNTYQLVINFPSIYNSTNYQDIIEYLEIIVEGNQITS